LKKFFIVTLLFVLASKVSHAQDSVFARKMVDTLTSSYFWGRGYTNNGMNKAAQFLASQFKSFGLHPLNRNSYLQTFSYPVNTFPGKMEVAINGKELVAGKDFIISPDSKGVKGKGTLVQKDSVDFIDVEDRIIVTLKDKLTWSVADKAADFTVIEVDKKARDAIPQTINATIENKLIKNFQTANVCGLVKGTTHPDSIIVLTAHYDHLGGMGKDTYFPGANDNASGTSLLLSLAKYYTANPQPYSIAFICFAGEEAGLLGSKYFASNPLITLSNTRFLINFDLVGTGDEGITVVNATEFTKEFTLLNAINDSAKYVAKINARGKAANSDHYWFTEKGVSSFFIYTLGGIKAYHDVFDKSATLPLNEYNDLFKLILQFNKRLMKSEL
jgi:aminopeptidase YwaD